MSIASAAETGSEAAPAPHPGARVLPFPRTALAEVQETLALELSGERGAPAPSASGAPGADLIPIPTRGRKQMETWTARFAQAAVEIVGGDRPASQLLRWTSPEVYADLEERAETVIQAAGVPIVGRVQRVRPKVASVHSCFLDDRRVEVAIRVRYGDRSRALAARFDRVDDLSGPRWVCTALSWS